MTTNWLNAAIILFAFVICLIIASIIAGFFRKHREVWDDIPNARFQESMNKVRKKHGISPKDIDYKTGMVK